MNFLGIIPARYNSTRFPGKPLAKLGRLSVIERVYLQSASILDEVYVATDDERIFSHVKEFQGNVIMTSEKHRSGTDRCAEAMDSIAAGTGNVPDVIINIQGDEPFIQAGQIALLKDSFDDEETQISTLVKKIDSSAQLFDPDSPKVVFDTRQFALYFSRSPIPFFRGLKEDEWVQHGSFYRHLGIYAYRRDILSAITRLDLSSLETMESLEQLRWLQNGYRIKVMKTRFESIGIDTPADLQKAIRYLKESGMD